MSVLHRAPPGPGPEPHPAGAPGGVLPGGDARLRRGRGRRLGCAEGNGHGVDRRKDRLGWELLGDQCDPGTGCGAENHGSQTAEGSSFMSWARNPWKMGTPQKTGTQFHAVPVWCPTPFGVVAAVLLLLSFFLVVFHPKSENAALFNLL